MSTKPFFSICIGVGPSEAIDRLSRTIESVIRQSLVAEIVLQPATVERENIIKEHFGGRKNISILPGGDGGFYDGANRAVIGASGHWVLFLGCGDSLLEPNVLEAVHNTAQHLPTEVAAIGCGVIMGEIMWPPPKPSFAEKIITRRNPFHSQGLFIRREFLLANRYEIAYKIMGDYDLYLRSRFWLRFIPLNVACTNFLCDGISQRGQIATVLRESLLMVFRNRREFGVRKGALFVLRNTGWALKTKMKCANR